MLESFQTLIFFVTTFCIVKRDRLLVWPAPKAHKKQPLFRREGESVERESILIFLYFVVAWYFRVY